jgi:hypothetical protein
MGAKFTPQKNSVSIVPGPGTYVSQTEKIKVKAPAFGFGTSQRPVIGGNKKL